MVANRRYLPKQVLAHMAKSRIIREALIIRLGFVVLIDFSYMFDVIKFARNQN